jgi:hypothetical protein
MKYLRELRLRGKGIYKVKFRDTAAPSRCDFSVAIGPGTLEKCRIEDKAP